MPHAPLRVARDPTGRPKQRRSMKPLYAIFVLPSYQ